ncbi:MAG TPA: cytochrome c [Steroidobacteraceae bacterium]|nr:cytochrome c [Steroidobacteraceae bacterium]
MPLSRRLATAALALALALGASASAFAAGDAARGKLLSYTCLGCHGIEDYRNAYPDYDVPRLGGQHADYIVSALQEYKSGARAHPTMQVQAATLSDQDMQDIAAYFASETQVRPDMSEAPAPPAKVAQLCVSCHGKDGIAVTSAYPDLAGQHENYIEQALQEYKLGERKNPVMSTFVVSLTPQDIREVAEYYAGLKPGLTTLARRLTFLP